jgi:hypothetical protein
MDMWWHWEKKLYYCTTMLKLAISIFFFVEFLLEHDREWPKHVGLPHVIIVSNYGAAVVI